MSSFETEVVAAVRAALGADDPEAGYYLDLVVPRVLRLCHGAVSDDDVSARQVENDEDRFVELPVVTESDEYEWVLEFVDDHDDLQARVQAGKKAMRRFLKSLTDEQRTEWSRYRTGRVNDVADAWLADHAA